MIQIEDIVSIEKNKGGKGYTILYEDGRRILLTKRRTIPALLILLKFGDGCEADLQKGSERLPEIKRILQGKMPNNWIQDSYADTKKPFSELWNEEGFVWITNTPGDRRLGSQRYVLNSEAHEKFFTSAIQKANRRSLTPKEKERIREKQDFCCNICKSRIYPRSKIKKHAFSRDRIREVFDHRIPVEKGGSSELENFQALCFYCNKSKWQICTICTSETCEQCVLAYPERNTLITPTQEDISDRM